MLNEIFEFIGGYICLVIIVLICSYYKNLKSEEKKEKKNIKQDITIKESPWREFEKEVADKFKQNGWEVELGLGYDDDGKDIIIKKGLAVYLIQCKHYYGNWFVGPNQIRDFQGAIDLYEKKNNTVVRGIFITSGKTTSKARDTAKFLRIELWDKWNRKDKIKNF